jgi:hypothetical protein
MTERQRYIPAAFQEYLMRRLPLALALMLAPVATTSLRAQLPPSSTIASGVWRGWMVRAEGDSVRVSYVVTQKGKSITIELHSPNNPDYGMSDVKLKDDVLTFSWALGQESVLLCRLSRRGGPGFDGICQAARRDSQGALSRLFINMDPPRTGGRGAHADSGEG